MVEEQTARVWYSPAAKRRYLTKSAAINAEARAKIYKRYPIEPYESDTGFGYNIYWDEPERYSVMHRRLSRLIRKSINEGEK